jgi:VWFA-related protein
MRRRGGLEVRSLRIVLALVGLLSRPLLAADSTTKGQDKPPVVSVSLALVQVDAVVTDGKGQHVDDLACEEFEILEDRRRQAITNCSFVRVPGSATLTPGVESPERAASGTRPVRREDVRRTMALVVDDLNLDLQSLVSVRAALDSFVQEQTAPGDLVSMVRTSGGVGFLQQFTTDRRVLRAAIERIRLHQWAPVDVFEPIGSIPVLPSKGRGPHEVSALRAEMLEGGPVGALRFVLMGLRDLPGRKSVVLFSNGHPLHKPDGELTPFGRAVPELVDLANRASIVIYTIDTVGVVTGQLTAADNLNTPGASADPFSRGVADPASYESLNTVGRAGAGRFVSGLDGLAALSDPTGGMLLRGGNSLSGQLDKVLADQVGYYLIGYVPDASTFRSGKPAFHRIQVKVRRKGVRVRSRSGFYGMTDDDPRVTGKQRDVTSLAASLMSPFSSSEVGLSLTSLFYQDNAKRALLHCFLHVEADDLSLAANPDGTFGSRAEIVAFTFNADGQVVDQLSRAGGLRLTPQARDVASRYGINYTIDVPVKKPGAYQLRVAFRDVASGRAGSAYQFVEVPDLGNDRLALSGVLMTQATPEGPDAISKGSPLPNGEASTFATAARRVFAPGQPLAYGLTVYNARVDHPGGQPSLEMRVRVLLDGKEVIRGEPRKVEAREHARPDAVFAGGILLLPRQMAAGEYQLLVTVVDALASPDRRMATQATVFAVEAPHPVQEN